MAVYIVRVKQLLLLTFQLGSGAPPGLGEVSLPTPVSHGGALHQGDWSITEEDAKAHVPLAEAMIEYADHRNPTSDGTSTVGCAALASSTATSSAAPFLELDNPECLCTDPQVMTEGSFPTSGPCCSTTLTKESLPNSGLLGEQQQSTANPNYTQSAPTSSMPNHSVHVMSTERNFPAGRTLGQRIMQVSHKYNLLTMSCIMCIVVFMQAAGDNGGGSNRDPPSWGPEQEAAYPFREYSHDILLWIFQTNLQPHQQCAAIMGRLRGEARDLARQMSAEEIARGAVVEGRPVDSVTLLFHALKQRFAPLAEEARLAAPESVHELPKT